MKARAGVVHILFSMVEVRSWQIFPGHIFGNIDSTNAIHHRIPGNESGCLDPDGSQSVMNHP
jgi:hypothetical protein